MFYWLREEKGSRYTGELNAVPRWGLPGVRCHECGESWASAGVLYPSVDLSGLPEHESFKKARAEPIEEFERLRERVRPLVPAGAPLPPGTEFGPLVGSAQGTFGSFHYDAPWSLLVRREALEALQAKGLRGLMGCRTELRFRQKKAPELLELQLEAHGQLHPDCLPLARRVACARCGGGGARRPEQPILDAASMPAEVDLFRLSDFRGMMIASERFVEAVRQLGLDGVAFHELPLR
jgi:uncharacterized double-CXXCG motif protein